MSTARQARAHQALTITFLLALGTTVACSGKHEVAGDADEDDDGRAGGEGGSGGEGGNATKPTGGRGGEAGGGHGGDTNGMGSGGSAGTMPGGSGGTIAPEPVPMPDPPDAPEPVVNPPVMMVQNTLTAYAVGKLHARAIFLPGAQANIDGLLWLATRKVLLVHITSGTPRMLEMDPQENFKPFPGPVGVPELDARGNVLIAERTRITRMTPAGQSMGVVADMFKGIPLSGIRDLVVRNDGSIFFAAGDGLINRILRVAPDRTVTEVTTASHGEGITLSVDQRILYVSERDTFTVKRYTLSDTGTATPLTPSWQVGGYRAFDGLCMDDAGNLYVVNHHGVSVFTHDGTLLGRIADGTGPGPYQAGDLENCSFGGADRKTLYLSTTLRTPEHPGLYAIAVPIPGRP